MKQYRHKKLGWIAKDQNGFFFSKDGNFWIRIAKQLILNSDDREEIKTPKEITPSLIFMKISPYINYSPNGYIKIDSESIKKAMDELYLNNQ